MAKKYIKPHSIKEAADNWHEADKSIYAGTGIKGIVSKDGRLPVLQFDYMDQHILLANTRGTIYGTDNDEYSPYALIFLNQASGEERVAPLSQEEVDNTLSGINKSWLEKKYRTALSVDLEESKSNNRESMKRYTIVSPSKQALRNKKLQESKRTVVRPRSTTEKAIKESIYSRSYAKPGKIYSPSYNKYFGNDEDKDVDYTPNFRFGEAMKKIKAGQKAKKSIKESLNLVGRAANCYECNELANIIYSRIQDSIAGFDGNIKVAYLGDDIEFTFDSERAYKISASFIAINTTYEIIDKGEADKPGTFFLVIR